MSVEQRDSLGAASDFPQRGARRLGHAVVEHRVDHQDLVGIVVAGITHGVGGPEQTLKEVMIALKRPAEVAHRVPADPEFDTHGQSTSFISTI